MLDLLWLIPAIPLASAILLAVLGSRFPRHAVGAIGTGSIGASAVVAILVALSFRGEAFRQPLWTWIPGMGGFGFYLDALSLVMVVVVTFVSFWIHLYSTEYMEESEGYSRFFAYMNLFVASMVTLVLAGNLLLLFLGWEGVGLCSYLLIGFWYQDPANGRAAQKAFIVTRVGDTAFTIGLLLLFTRLGTLEIQDLMSRATAQWPVNSTLAVAAAALLVGGAVGKSAQLPLQTWLPDAMVGPTPTSALIHAATMVTAGVYLIARTHALFTLAPAVMRAVAVIGAATLLMSGISALTQVEIKKALAYSTISQIGYMFLALGVGAWSAAIFHFMTHAFFKALLFLTAGVVIESLHHENDIFRMGGMRRYLPVAFWAFLIGGCALAGLPFVTSGFYSKDLILWSAWSSDRGATALWVAGLAGVFLTSLYTFRLILIVFFGRAEHEISKRPRFAMTAPLIVLAVLSIIGGFVNVVKFLGTALPPIGEAHGGKSEALSGAAAAALFFLGLVTAWLLYARRRPSRARFRINSWGMDRLYGALFVRPVLWFAAANKSDAVDKIFGGSARAAESAWRGMSATETGRVRWYAAGIVGGTVVLLAIAYLV